MIQSRSAEIRRILWAVDPFQESEEVLDRCANSIRLLLNTRKIEIEPVYILPLQHISTAFEVVYPPVDLSVVEDAERIIQQKLGHLRVPGLLKPKILEKMTMSKTGAVKVLMEYAHETQSGLITVGTHGRKGAARFFLGSFAETLLLHSSIPILMVPNSPLRVSNYGRILFPTDFGPMSELIYSDVVALAESLHSKLTLFHVIPEPTVMSVGLIPLEIPWPILEEEKRASQKIAESYRKKANDRGVEAEVQIQVSRKPVSELVLDFAEKNNTGLIAMAAQTGALASTLVGSTTRQVVRGADSPVWVLYAPAYSKTLKREQA